MSFFDRIRKGTLFFGKKEPNVIVEFTFKGERFILEQFDIEFSQSVDSRNKPDGQIKGGEIFISFLESSPEQINTWMLSSSQKSDGTFRFLKNDGKIVEGAHLIIDFKQGYCVRYSKIINPNGGGTLTSLEIKAKYIQIGNEEFENDWR